MACSILGNNCTSKCSHLNLAQILPCKNLSKHGAHRQKWPGANLLKILLEKTNARQNLRKITMKTYKFPSALHGRLHTWEKSSTFKGKCVVNAVNFISNLLTGPLIKMVFEGPWTILKARAFQEAYSNIEVSFHETVPLRELI